MNVMFAIFNLGGGEIILIILLVLILFGAKKIPELAKGLGQGIKEFKKATNEVSSELHNAMDDNNYSSPPPKKIEQPQKPAEAPRTESSTTVPRSPENKS